MFKEGSKRHTATKVYNLHLTNIRAEIHTMNNFWKFSLHLKKILCFISEYLSNLELKSQQSKSHTQVGVRKYTTFFVSFTRISSTHTSPFIQQIKEGQNPISNQITSISMFGVVDSALSSNLCFLVGNVHNITQSSHLAENCCSQIEIAFSILVKMESHNVCLSFDEKQCL